MARSDNIFELPADLPIPVDDGAGKAEAELSLGQQGFSGDIQVLAQRAHHVNRQFPFSI